MARRTDGVGKEVKGVGAGSTNGGRIWASQTVGIEAVGYGIFEIAFGTGGNAKGFAWIHGRTANRTLRDVERNEGTTTGTADAMGNVIRGMKCDEDGGRLQANETNG